MPHFNADNHRGLHEPITFALHNKTYNVKDLSDEIMDEIAALDDPGATGTKLSEILRLQLGLLTGANPEEFSEASIRELTGVISWIMEQLVDPRGAAKAKNLRGR
jgi:hypothetical protein